MAYLLHLTEDDMETIRFVGDRYFWSTGLLSLDTGDNHLSESTAWNLCDYFEQDMVGGHSPFPLLDPGSDLCLKLQEFWDSVV